MTRTRSCELAAFGGAPAFDAPLHVGCPNVPNRAALHARLDEILDRRWFTNDGPCVHEFEWRIAQYLGVQNAVAVVNATAGLQLVASALELEGEVIVPAMTFVATAHAFTCQRLTPVFCDVDPYTHNLDPRCVEECITPRTSAIVGVHLWGRPCSTGALERVARRHGVKLIYDAAHAFGCGDQGRMIGAAGDAEVFSFHATKFLNAFEGGVIATNDDALAERLRLARNFGFAGWDNVVCLGTNAKMHEFSAAAGLTMLDDVALLVEENRRRYELYRRELSGLPGVSLVEFDARQPANFQYIVAMVDEQACGLSRDDLLHILHAENVLARRYFFPGCHRMAPYRDRRPLPHLPVTDRLLSQVVALPTGTAVSELDVRVVCSIVRTAVELAARGGLPRFAGGTIAQRGNLAVESIQELRQPAETDDVPDCLFV